MEDKKKKKERKKMKGKKKRIGKKKKRKEKKRMWESGSQVGILFIEAVKEEREKPEWHHNKLNTGQQSHKFFQEQCEKNYFTLLFIHTHLRMT